MRPKNGRNSLGILKSEIVSKLEQDISKKHHSKERVQVMFPICYSRKIKA
jgi:hypothetical protein